MGIRKIVFRGKRTDTGEWVYGDLIQWEGGMVEIAPIERDNVQYTVKPDTVGQYTGMEARNWKEIYEGDLLRSPEGNIMIVEWAGSGFVTRCLTPTCDGMMNTNRCAFPVCTVEGNIHDNPELLEDGE